MYVDLSKIEGLSDEELCDTLSWASLSQRGCMSLVTKLARQGFANGDASLVIRAVERLLQRTDPPKVFKNFQAVLVTILNRLVKEFGRGEARVEFSVKFTRLCNLLSSKHKRTKWA